MQKEEQDLGVIITDNLTFDKHISTNIIKANQIIRLIRRTIKYIDNHSVFFKGLMRSHVEYATNVWSVLL